MRLGEDFLWGGGTAASQCEGAWDVGGKGLNIMDLVTAGSLTSSREITGEIEPDKVYPSQTGNDFYNRYVEDIALLADLGLKSFRLSIDWTRIYPTGEENEPNQAGLRFYHEVIDELLAHDIEPLVTILHIELPVHIARKYGAWTSRETIDLYLKYCGTLFTEFKGKVRYWLTFNEVNHQVFFDNDNSDVYSYMVSGLQLSTLDNPPQALATSCYNALVAGAKAVALGHQIDPENMVGCVLAFVPQYPATSLPEDSLAGLHGYDRDLFLLDVMCRGAFPRYKLMEYQRLGIHLEITEEDAVALKAGTIDFCGMNYYSSGMSAAENRGYENGFFHGYRNPLLKTNDWGWEDDPVGLRYALNYVDRRYGKPIIITESGIGVEDELVDGTVEDDYRIAYLREHIREVEKAIVEDGVNCLGYFTWAPIDLVSASTGEMKKRYGVVYVDRHDDGTGDYQRFKKKSFDWYRKVIASRGEDLA